MKSHFLKTISLLLLLYSFSGKAQEFTIHEPSFLIEGIGSEIFIESTQEDLDAELIIGDERIAFSKVEEGYIAEFVIRHKQAVSVSVSGKQKQMVFDPIPIWLSVLPPLITIVLALIIKEVISSLFIGLFLGAFIIELYKYGFVLGFIKAFMSCLDIYIVEAMNDGGHISVIVFSLLIGGMVNVINNSGGMQGVVNSIKKYARSARSGQLATWALGIAIFFDDYANTLVVGKTMRPVTDSLKISREKLAYLVDSTAAPIASIALITTWIGAELGYIADGISNIDQIDEGVYSIFLSSLQYSYYPILSLIFILILIKKGKDYGPMLEAERLARFGRMSPKIEKSEDEFEKQFEDEAIEGKANKWLAIIPIIILLSSTIAGLFYTAYDSQLWSSDRSFFYKLSETIGNSDSYRALLWGSSAGLVSSIVLSYFSNRSSISHLIGKAVEGIKGMVPAIAILVLAWSLAIVIEDLHTADFLSSMFNDKINPYFIPLITFLLSAIIAFSTGSSWGTMAILYPLILPLSWQICEGSGMATAETMNIFYNVVSSVLAGSVLGDHCSPISDTTILSSLASDCDHIQHVRTQMPYALTVGLVACIAGTIPAAYGSPFWINLPIAIGLLWLVVHFAGEVADEET